MFKNLKLISKGLQRQIRVRKGIKEIQNLLNEKGYLLFKKYIIGLRVGDKFLDNSYLFHHDFVNYKFIKILSWNRIGKGRYEIIIFR